MLHCNENTIHKESLPWKILFGFNIELAYLIKGSLIEYECMRNAFFCGVAHHALFSSNADPSFPKNGISKWKNAMEKRKEFKKHEFSDLHVEAVGRYVTTPATVIANIGD